jgi:hypothetical protein
MINSTSLKSDLIRAKIYGAMRKAINKPNTMILIKNQKGRVSLGVMRQTVKDTVNHTNRAFQFYSQDKKLGLVDITETCYKGLR